MVIKKPMTEIDKARILQLVPSPIYGSTPTEEKHLRAGKLLVDLGYIAGWGLRSDLPDDLRELKVWD